MINTEKSKKVLGNYEKRKCEVKECNKTFYVPRGRTKKNRQINIRDRNARTCSPECSRINTRRAKRKWKNMLLQKSEKKTI